MAQLQMLQHSVTMCLARRALCHVVHAVCCMLLLLLSPWVNTSLLLRITSGYSLPHVMANLVLAW